MDHGPLTLGLTPSGEVCVQVGVAERIDRLFRIAHHEKGSFVKVNGAENFKLQRVGILEFVDQGHRKAFSQYSGQPWELSRGENVMQIIKHVIVGNHMAILLGFADGAGRRFQNESFNPDRPS